MKKSLLLSIGYLLVLAACGSTKEAFMEPIISDIVKGQVEKKIYSENGMDSTNCSIDYSYFAEVNIPYKDSINQKIKNYITRITQFESRLVKNSIISHSFFDAQLDSFDVMCKVEFDEDYYHLWELEALIEIDDSKESIVQLQLTSWSYTGGAHGNGETITLIFEKSKAERLLLEDIFTDVAAVTTIGETYFRELYQLEPEMDLDDAGFWFENNLFQLNSNFSIVGDKIIFLYNSYEIAPYSGGQTVIEIPIEEVRNYLKIKI